MKHLTTLSVCALLGLVLSACSGDDNDDTPEAGVLPKDRTYVIFNPAFSQLPTPNDILFAGETAADGTMSAGVDPENPVIGGIDVLDGNSLISPLDITFSGSLSTSQSLDAGSFAVVGTAIIPNPDQNVFLLPLTFPSGDGLLQASADINDDGAPESIEVPTFAEALAYQTAVATGNVELLSSLAVPTARAEILSLDGGQNNVLRISPLKPLLPKTKYLVVLTNMVDENDNPVFRSGAYESIRDPDTNLAGVSEALLPLRPAVQTWEQLAQGYFGFMQSVYSAASISASAPVYDDILLTLTFTTTAAEDILTSVAAPETFFEDSIRSGYKKDAIVKLVTGVYTLDGVGNGLTSVTDGAINQTLSFLLTSPILPDESPNPLYNPAIAGGIAQGASYAVLAEDASAAYLMQRAATEAAIQVHDSGDALSGDKEPFVDIASEALGTVLALSSNNPAALFPIPGPRVSSFFRVDSASAINPALAAPALVYQGQITLPEYQVHPSESGVELVTDTWTADPTIGGIIDFGKGQPEGTTPPSPNTTYRFPFPSEKAQATAPIMAVLPDATTLGNFGISKPEAGWPVVISLHGITTDRSTTLPVADAMAFACVASDLSGPSGAPCFATIAIDRILHGLAPSGGVVAGLYGASDPAASIEPNVPADSPNAVSESLQERHFNFTADAAAQPMAMNYDAGVGASGSLFINLSNFANGRDHLRQTIIDLLNVNASISTMDIDGDGLANDLDPSRVYFIGTSLGGIEGIPFVAINNSAAVQSSPFNALPEIKAAVFVNTGGGIPRLLTNSPSFSGQILGGLAAASDQLSTGTSGLETYLNVFQGVLDSVDPIHYAPMLAASRGNTGILLTEIVGDGSAAHPSDQTIPNAADERWGAANGPLATTLGNGFVVSNSPAPLSGTEPLLAQFGAIKTADAVASADPAVVVTRFTEGSHGTSISAGNTAVDEFSSAAVFAEMVTEMVSFFALDGVLPGSIVVNSDVVED